MKHFTNLIVLLAWYLGKISDINATNTNHEEQIKKLHLLENLKSDVINATGVMIAFTKNILLITSNYMYIIYSENSTQIVEIEQTHMSEPTSILKAPDGAFDVPSVTVTSEVKITQLDVSDPLRPKITSDLVIGKRDQLYYAHVWINKNEFLVAAYRGLIHFENKNEGEIKKWNGKELSDVKYEFIFLFQNNPFIVFYAADKYSGLDIIWSEDENRKPGDLRNEKHIKRSQFQLYPSSITCADVNNDGKTDLLVLSYSKKFIENKVKRHVDVKAYEIPYSDEFREHSKYKEHVLYKNVSSSLECKLNLKAFTPFVSYEGKPWILIGDSCDESSYLQPESQEIGNWDYKNYFITGSGKVKRIEVADINQDGYTELFLLSDRLYEYSFSNVTPPSTSSSSLYLDLTPPTYNKSTSSSSSILYLDSTLPDPSPVHPISKPSSSKSLYLDSTLPDPSPTHPISKPSSSKSLYLDSTLPDPSPIHPISKPSSSKSLYLDSTLLMFIGLAFPLRFL